jgi:hypothetical protein
MDHPHGKGMHREIPEERLNDLEADAGGGDTWDVVRNGSAKVRQRPLNRMSRGLIVRLLGEAHVEAAAPGTSAHCLSAKAKSVPFVDTATYCFPRT